MKLKIDYPSFCKKFDGLKFPELKFKDINSNISKIYKKKYNLTPQEINKASFFIFIIISMFFFIISFVFLNGLKLFMGMIIGILIALMCSYLFNLKLYKCIKKEEAKLNSILFIIKIYFSLLVQTLGSNSDNTISFIELIKELKIQISKEFMIILGEIQEGISPEECLGEYVSYSNDFNYYVKCLSSNYLQFNKRSIDFKSKTLEQEFQIFLNQLDSRLSLIFFIGLFYPLGLDVLIIFQHLTIIQISLFIFFFYLILKIAYKKTLNKNFYLLGFLFNHSKKEKQFFIEFVDFLNTMAHILKQNVSPEKAFIETYFQKKGEHTYFSEFLSPKISTLLNLSSSINDVFDSIIKNFENLRYKIIFKSIKQLLDKNAFNSSKGINKILKILYFHSYLEKKLDTMIKGEKFKIFLFIFMLPPILGIIGGLFPIYFTLLNYQNLNNNFLLMFYLNDALKFNTLIIFGLIGFCLLISVYFFLKIIDNKNKILILFIVSLIYGMLFFFTLYNMILLL
ncbi:MAG: hypothetical protein ACTSO4_01665 [Promethearchaeota archaeon]